MGQLALVTTPVEAVAEAVRRVSGGQGTEGDLALLRALRFVGGDDELSDWGKAFDDNWWVYSDKDEATTIYKAGVLLLPETEGLMQVLHGRGALPVAGVAYYLARHGLTDTEDEKAVRRFLQMVNGLGIVAYSNQKQTVRLVEPLPDESGDEAPAVRVIEPDRP